MTEIETLLRRTGEDLQLHRPVDDVLARGWAIRRRRRSAVVAVALVLVAVVGLSTTWWTRDGGPGPASSSGPAMIRLAPPQLRAAEASCRDGVIRMTPARFRGGRVRLFAAGETAVGTILLYHDDRSTIVCHDDGGGSGPLAVKPGPGRELTTASYGRDTAGYDASHLSALDAYGRVDATVARVVGTVHGRRIEAAIGNGWYWLDTPATGDAETPVPPLDLRAYDASGHLLTLVTVTG